MAFSAPISIKPDLDATAQDQARLHTPALTLHIWDEKEAQALLQEFEDRIPKGHVILTDKAVQKFLGSVFALSPYLKDLAYWYPQTVLSCFTEGFKPALDVLLQTLHTPFGTMDALKQALRIVKKQAALIIGLADLSGSWLADRVGQAMAEVADGCLQAAVNFLLKDAHTKGKLNLPDETAPQKQCGMTVLAMGKHGAQELNYSSDIDLIVLIDPHAKAVLEASEAIVVFTRLVKQLIQIMQDRTADGYVFRTDLRLRPDPGSMPLAIPLSLALRYYESRGQNWERAALIKARAIAGDLALGEEFLDAIQPFIWRRYLDYAAIADIHSIKRQIQAHKGLTELQIPNHNVKLGRGGIREIEFFVQTQQLIAGGRLPHLRQRKTLDMLQELARCEWIKPHVAQEMKAHYLFLRDVEHRLQMVADAQTHTMPEDEQGIARIASLCGFADSAQFSKTLTHHLLSVEKHYAALFASEDPLGDIQGNLSFTGDDDDPDTIRVLENLGFERPSSVIATVRAWHYGRYAAMTSAEARERLTELTPDLLRALADTGSPQEALLAFDEFLKGLPAGFQLFSLLNTNRQLLDLLVRILGTAPALARIITRRPHVFDGLLEPGFFNAVPTTAFFQQTLERSLSLARNYEDGLERLRIVAAEQRFLIGIRVLSGSMDPADCGPVYSILAQCVLAAAIEWVRQPFEENHGSIKGAEFGVMALGNFAAKMLTASSDLDVIFLYRFDPERHTSNGPRPLHASQYFGRFTQRLIAALSAPTAEGVAYELDLRLRPAGQAGPIATSLRAFDTYYRNDAWTWELLALTRGQMVYGGTPFKEDCMALRDRVLSVPRPVSDMAKDVRDMRLLLDKEHEATSEWDVKRSAGGLMDINFIEQFEQLASQSLGRSWLVKNALQNDNVTLKEAQSTYLSVLQMMRLCLGNGADFEKSPSGFKAQILALLDMPTVETAQAHLKDTQKAVRAFFLNAMKQGREVE